VPRVLAEMGMELPLTVVVLLAAALGVWIAIAFNRLVRNRNLVREGWSGIDVQLRRRHDLIPNLVEAVRGYSRHEQTTFEQIAAQRNAAAGATGVREAQDRENALTGQIRQLFALAEAYPDLKASTNYLDLQGRLTQIEDQIQMARRYYNGAARDYNISVESFPSNLVARLFRFQQAEFFQIETATERAAPKVEA